MRREVCRLCGGVIEAKRGDWNAIFAAVYRHRLTDLHLAALQRGVA